VPNTWRGSEESGRGGPQSTATPRGAEGIQYLVQKSWDEMRAMVH